MFGIGSTEFVVILIVALVLIGPSKLPDIMRMVGKGVAEVRRMSMDVKSTLQQEIEKAEEAKRIAEAQKEYFGDMVKAEPQAQAVAAEPEHAPGEPEQAANAAPATAEQGGTPQASSEAPAKEKAHA